jgi:hypothetical protein
LSRRAALAAALLAPWLALGVAPPASAVSAAKFGGGSHGAPVHSTPGSHGTQAKAGTRAPHPELLHGASPQAAAEALHGQARAEAEAQAQARQQAEAEAQQRAFDEAYAPWAAAPHMKVRLTGDPVLDAQLLWRLNAELATPIDPDRIRAGSLADDSLADDALARQSPRPADEAQQRLWRFLRSGSMLDVYHLADAMRPLKGDVLLLMAHIDARDNTLVFKGADGRPRRLPRDVFEQAAREAGVQLLTVGCRSARQSSAGFVDDLNSLDAARAMAQAMRSRPTTLFELYGALSGPERVMQFDAASFVATHDVEVTLGADGAVVTRLHWSGPVASVLLGAAATDSAPATETQAPAAPPASWWTAPAMRTLLGTVAVSWLLGALLVWWSGHRGGALAGRVSIDALAHVLLVPFGLTVFAQAVDGGGAVWWAWGAAVLLGLATAVLALMAAMRPSKPSPADPQERAWCALLALRAAVLTAPFMAVALLHTGWFGLPVPLLNVLLLIYGLGRPLPGPGAFLFGAFVLAFCWAYVEQKVAGWRKRLETRRANAGRAVLWREQLAADGVHGTAAEGAVRSRLAFEARCARPVAREARLEEARVLSDVIAPDPWAGGVRRQWRLVAVPLVGRGDGVEAQVGFGLLRLGSPFLHPVPPLLLQRRNAQPLQPAELMTLLARIERRLRWSDYLPLTELPPVKDTAMAGLFWAAVAGGLAWLSAEGTWGRRIGAPVAGVILLAAVVWPCVRWLHRRWRQRWLQRLQPQPQPAGREPPSAATA